ncbi:Fur-regulated basic protein FbpA [Bacillus mycoides]|nr:Fur-regulated basic protein FbpA [Bacillus mycoides]
MSLNRWLADEERARVAARRKHERARQVNRTIDRHVFKLPDGRDLYEGSCEELRPLLKGDEESNGRNKLQLHVLGRCN